MNINFKSNKKKILDKVEQAEERALETIGGMAESFAKANLRNNHSVQTGLLRNSITHARGGKKPAISSYKADKGDASGEYSGDAPADRSGEKSVYIGTNVEYAPYVELGTRHSTAKPFLRPAAEGHSDAYRKVLEEELKSVNE